jgi:hypothetical protein
MYTANRARRVGPTAVSGAAQLSQVPAKLASLARLCCAEGFVRLYNVSGMLP